MLVTFYSFKGGVGRSMALANVGELLARAGLRVLMVDMDLEAPGLERFFADGDELTTPEEIEERRGMIDFVTSYKELRALPRAADPADAPPASATRSRRRFPIEPLSAFIAEIARYESGGSLQLIPAGRRAGAAFRRYGELVQRFDWNEFYQRWDGEWFFDTFRSEALRIADVVLLDSRTGIAELSGVCTFHLADVVAMFVAPNEQNLAGCELMAQSLREPALVKDGRRGRELEVLPVPSRIDNSEADSLDRFAEEFATRLGRFAASRLKFEGTLFNALKIPYVPAFAYREGVAVREPDRTVAVDMVGAYRRLVDALADLAPESSRMRSVLRPVLRTGAGQTMLVEELGITAAVMVGVGIGSYEHLPPLPYATSDVTAVAAQLGKVGFSTTTVVDQSREGVVRALYDALPVDGLGQTGTVLIILWAGYATPSPDDGSLRLLTAGNRPEDPGGLVVTAEQVAEIAARSGASQLLLIFDTSLSGGAVADMALVVDAVRRRQVRRGPRWLGVVAACQSDEQALDGALGGRLLDLLRHGPSEPALKVRWSSYQAGVRGDDLVDALVKEWDEPRQTPMVLSAGEPLPILPNPLHRPGTGEQVVEHLLWAARGGTQSEAGIWFTGRETPLREIVEWLAARQPGLCAVTGPAGCGKSAVAGRIVSLANPDERARIAAARGLPPADLDPGEGTVSAHLQARGLTLERCTELLAHALGVVGAGSIPNHHDVLAWASNANPAPVVVLDGLDEAGPEGFRIATDLLAPLASYALVLVATREAEGDGTGPSLLDSLGVPAVPIDLEADPEAIDRDVHAYVCARLSTPAGTPLDAAMDPRQVAEEVVRLARADEDAAEGPFLLARILTSQLIAQPVDTSAPRWHVRLSISVEEAFARDLAEGGPLVRDGQELPHAGSELLSALAYSYGAGFPADDVWPAVASALSPTGTSYGRLDVYWALGEYGRYVTASGLSGQAVYRLHQRLADTLRNHPAAELVDGGRHDHSEGDAEKLVAQSVLDVYDRFLQSGEPAVEHPYLWLYAWRHAIAGELPAIDLLESLAQREATLQPDVAMALNSLGSRYSEIGRHADALPPAERAVEIYEQLAKDNPASLNDLASALNNLGNRYSEIGRHTDALPPAERAVEIREQLAKTNPAFLNDLAMSLNNLGNRYSEIGRRADALPPTERAVEIYEQLAKTNPAFLNDLASALNNLGIRYSEIGRRADALPPTERAVEIREQLAKTNPAFLNDLAMSLNNLGNRYSEIGRRADALPPTERAVEIREQLAKTNPAFLNDLASALNNLGTCYSEIGRRTDALPPTERAVEIYEQLAKTNPAFLNNLAMSLNNLGSHYSAIGRHTDALPPTERAVEIYEQLAKTNPAFLNDLAMSLNNLGNRYSEIGRHTDALPPAERAAEINEQLAQTNPAFLHNLAMSLNNLGIHYSEIGQYADALPPTERAVEINEQLAQTNPAFLHNLAMSLNNLGNRYSAIGQYADALPPTERAAEINEQLAQTNPAFLNDLAMSLNNLGNHYSAIGRHTDALPPTERAVEINERLAKTNPGFLNDLASALNNLGNRYSAIGRHTDALPPAERAAEIYEQLAKTNPAFLNNLAMSLNNLGNRYSEIGRRADALPPTERAVEINERLAKTNPGFLNNLAMSLNNLGNHYSAMDNGAAGLSRWSTVLERFASDPIASVVLRLRRTRSDEELDEAINDALDAYRLDPRKDTLLTGAVHSACRSVRTRNPERFDAIWRAGTGELPPWLTVDAETLSACAAWLQTPTWQASRDYIAAHTDLLLCDAGEIALAEIALDHPNNPAIELHEALLRVSRDDGIDSAYKQLLIAETARAWRAVDNLGESKRFLLERRDQLLTDEALAALEDDVVGVALLTLARLQEIDLAYRVMDSTDVQAGALTDARRHGPPDKLRAIAALCFATSDSQDRQTIAATHLAIALAIGGQAEEAIGLARDIRQGGPQMPQLLDDLADAITYNPQHAGSLAALIRELSQTDALSTSSSADGA